MAIIAITTRSSMSVKPLRVRGRSTVVSFLERSRVITPLGRAAPEFLLRAVGQRGHLAVPALGGRPAGRPPGVPLRTAARVGAPLVGALRGRAGGWTTPLPWPRGTMGKENGTPPAIFRQGGEGECSENK